MFETKKIRESEYFYQRMEQEQSNYDNFSFNLSAFLSSTRSVMQYILNEAKTKTNGQSWYDSKVSGSAILQYFKNKRNINIHAEPVKPSMNVTVFVPSMQIVVTVPPAKSPEEEQRNHEIIGRAISKTLSGQDITDEERELLSKSKVKIEDGVGGRSDTTFSFDDWSGPESVLVMCKTYLNTLKTMVAEGRSRGFITP